MASLNEVNLIGNLGADPEIRSVGQSGARVANFTLATSEKWKDKNSGETRERTEWSRIVVWGDGLVGVVEKYLKKGSKVYVKGQLQTRKWEKDGVDHYTTEIVLQGFGAKLVMLDGARSGESDRPTDRPQSGYSSGPVDDDIPFMMEWR